MVESKKEAMMTKQHDALTDSHFRLLFESLPGLYLVLTTDFTIVAASNAYLQATMTKREAIIGHRLFDIFPDNPDDPTATGVQNLRTSLQRVLREHVADTMAVQQYDVRRSDGTFEERYWSPINSPVLDSDNRLLYIIHRVEDVTEFIRLKQQDHVQQQEATSLRSRAEEMELEVYLRAQEIQRINHELKRATEAKDQFLANMSHELRTPLNAIIGFTGTLLMQLPGPLTADQQRQLQIVQSNAKYLLSLISDILDLAKIEAGQVELSLEPVVCQNVIDDVMTSLRPFTDKKGLHFTCRCPYPQLVVQTDQRVLKQIVLNLAQNAIKFTDAGSVTITLGQQQLQERSWVTICVEDTGIGITAEDQTHLFTQFGRVNSTEIYQRDGTGLGLYLSQKLAELLSGKITVESKYGEGSRFTLHIPDCYASR